MAQPIFHSQYTAAQIEASIGKSPRINETTHMWEVWSISRSAYVSTGIIAESEAYAEDAEQAAVAANDYMDQAQGYMTQAQQAASYAQNEAAQAEADRRRAEAAATRAETAAALTDVDDNNTQYSVAWSVRDGHPVLTLTEISDL